MCVSATKRARKPAKTEKQSGDSQSLRNTEDSYRKIASLVAVVLLVAVLVGGITGGVVWYVMQKQVGSERTVQVPSNPAVSVDSKPGTSTSKQPPVTASPVTTPTVSPQRGVAPTSAKAPARKPVASTVTHLKTASPVDVVKHRPSTSVRKVSHSADSSPSNSSGWAQLKELRTHR